ncbi:MAG: hypothetical protein Q4F95_02955 [Oscillospiraceae bacterium]|nr:hypothetical protein [Oscillospiraceae bacterium]
MDKNNFFNLYGTDLRQKNNMTDGFNLQMTPQMRRMFSGAEQSINPLEMEASPALLYKCIGPKELKTRPITKEEYSRLSSSQTHISRRLQYGQLAVILALAVVLFICIFKNLGEFSVKETSLILLFIAGLLFFFGLKIKNAVDSVIKPGELIAEGTAIFFSVETTNRGNKNSTNRYLVSAAFHDQKSFMKKIICCKDDFSKMSLDSKVYVKVKGSKAMAFAAEQN